MYRLVAENNQRFLTRFPLRCLPLLEKKRMRLYELSNDFYRVFTYGSAIFRTEISRLTKVSEF
jgi:hypothetical protein